MRFFATIFAAIATIGFVSAAPATRSPTDVLDVLTELQGTSEPILTQINALTAAGTANDDSVTPLTNQLGDALSNATASLNALQADDRRRGISSRSSDEDVSTVTASITRNILTTMDGLQPYSDQVTNLDSINESMDGHTSTLLGAVGVLVNDLLCAVAQLLVDLAGVVRVLDFDLTGDALGL
ncbi:hypothetical protein FISHEDRAFT_70203 [Fistulina hepatica ATCC 64428]|uniref:Uncharacterized protein n=1 Tax=Fistulina hepatica ATCC 64428 TaxID=1128425 RepID=A0A0D7AK52_9AGAR|nr:hypothetical protein FISHEDRAFT_70203 [Fistulina hepatica ATCC 64428]